ncbi:MAG: glycosyltransferase, partial [bacterium]
MIAAGGTGGHVYPAVAVARELAALAPGRPLTFLGGAAGLEARVVPREGVRFLAVPSGPGRRSRPWTAVRGAALALQGAVRARAVLRAERASAVFSTGGFAAAPTLIAAAATGIPIVLHEPNEVPGLVTRLFARVAARVTTGSAGAAARIGGARVLVTGVPV